jgi:hypothetical protein
MIDYGEKRDGIDRATDAAESSAASLSNSDQENPAICRRNRYFLTGASPPSP